MNTRTLTMTAVAAVAAFALAGCGANDPEDGSGVNGDGSSTVTSSAAPEASATPAEGEHNAADVMFARMMIPHHAQAIEMSDMILAKDGVDERVLDLAEQVKAAQGPEITQMTGWLEGWGEEVPDTSMGGHGSMGSGSSMGGMMSAEDMEALGEADGQEGTRLFLEQMIEHHDGAIDMARMALDQGQNAEVKELTEAIIDAQQEEITTMEEILATL